MKRIIYQVTKTAEDFKPLIPRILVGWVFLSEGIQKYLFPELLGTGRFAKIGFIHPDFWAYFVGTFEILCGAALLFGLLTRLATVPLFAIMGTALVTTKLPILLEKGFWAMSHEARTDFSMTLLLVFLIIYGAGKWSVDEYISRKCNKNLI